MKKENELKNISNGLKLAIRNNIVTKKTTKLLIFHENITKLVFLWPNMGQESFKVLLVEEFQL